MSQVTTQEQQITAATDPEPATDLRQDAIAKIVAEAQVSSGEAGRTLDWIGRLAKKARNPNNWVHGLYHLTDAELRSREYKVFDAVMQHGEISAPGTAHAAIERVVLRDSEYSLMHDQIGEEVQYCTVSITVASAS